MTKSANQIADTVFVKQAEYDYNMRKMTERIAEQFEQYGVKRPSAAELKTIFKGHTLGQGAWPDHLLKSNWLKDAVTSRLYSPKGQTTNTLKGVQFPKSPVSATAPTQFQGEASRSVSTKMPGQPPIHKSVSVKIPKQAIPKKIPRGLFGRHPVASAAGLLGALGLGAGGMHLLKTSEYDANMRKMVNRIAKQYKQYGVNVPSDREMKSFFKDFKIGQGSWQEHLQSSKWLKDANNAKMNFKAGQRGPAGSRGYRRPTSSGGTYKGKPYSNPFDDVFWRDFHKDMNQKMNKMFPKHPRLGKVIGGAGLLGLLGMGAYGVHQHLKGKKLKNTKVPEEFSKHRRAGLKAMLDTSSGAPYNLAGALIAPAITAGALLHAPGGSQIVTGLPGLVGMSVASRIGGAVGKTVGKAINAEGNKKRVDAAISKAIASGVEDKKLNRKVQGILGLHKAAAEIKPDLPTMVTTGLGAGTALGGAHGLSKNVGNLKTISQLGGQLPIHEANISKLQALLTEIRSNSPDLKNIGDRQLTNALLQRKVSPKMYHTLQQGTEALSGRSRASKLIRMLKGQTRKSMVRHGILGAGLGLGGGLLGATALGHFDS